MDMSNKFVSVIISDRGKSVLKFFIIFLFVFVSLYIASPGTSPSNPYIGVDTSVFLTVGSSFSEGALPYRDYFDHKGPLLYYIYAIAQYDTLGKLGIFVLQTLAWSISVYAVWNTFRLFIKRELSMILLVVFLICSYSFICEGGLTEEWSLPVSCVLLYIVLRYLKFHDNVSELPSWIWLSLGFGVAWHVMLRVTNAGVTCGEIAALLLMLVHERAWKKTVLSVIWMLIGFLILLFPVIAVYIVENAEKELWYGLYTFNCKYAMSAFGYGKISSVFLKICPSIVLILLTGCFCNLSGLSSKVKLLVYSVAITTTLSLLPGYALNHYFINFAPIICCSLLFFGVCVTGSLHIAKRNKYLLALVTLVFLVHPYVMTMKNQILHGLICALLPGHPVRPYNDYVRAKHFSELIKKSDASSVLAIDCTAEIYCYMGIRPCNKFFFLQSFLSKSDSEIKTHVVNCLDSEKHAPGWLVLPKQYMDEQQSVNKISKDFASRIKEHYYYVDSGLLTNGHSEHSYSLYRRKRTK